MIFSFSPVMMTYRFIDVHIIGWFKELGMEDGGRSRSFIKEGSPGSFKPTAFRGV